MSSGKRHYKDGQIAGRGQTDPQQSAESIYHRLPSPLTLANWSSPSSVCRNCPLVALSLMPFVWLLMDWDFPCSSEILDAVTYSGIFCVYFRLLMYCYYIMLSAWTIPVLLGSCVNEVDFHCKVYQGLMLNVLGCLPGRANEGSFTCLKRKKSS